LYIQRRFFGLVASVFKKNEFVLSLGICFKIFLFHIVFVLAFGLSFGGVGGNQAVSYQVGVNLDSSGSQWS